jgi:hypothetical protein
MIAGFDLVFCLLDTVFVQRFLSPYNLLAALILSATALGFSPKPVSADTTGFLTLINSYRQQHNLGTLTEDQKLTNASCWLATDLDKNGFSHTDSLGRDMATRLSDYGVTGSNRGENIFYTTSSSSPEYAFDAWKSSPGHNANMLGSSYTRIGIGRSLVNNRWYWVTDFASGTADPLTLPCGQTAYATPYTTPYSTPKTPSNPTAATTTPTNTQSQTVTPTATSSAAASSIKIATTEARKKIESESSILENSPDPDNSKPIVAAAAYLFSIPILFLTSIFTISPSLFWKIWRFLNSKVVFPSFPNFHQS